jgi:hypothetical protein
MSFKKYESRRLLARKHRRAQRTWLLLALGGVFLIGAAFFLMRGNQNSQPLTAIEVHGAPSLKADQEQIDLGDVPLGQTVQVSFRLTNVGDQPLRFSEKPYIEVVEGC